MTIIYRIFHNWNTNQLPILRTFGINAELGYYNFDIEEKVYLAIKPYFDKWGVIVSFGTIYDDNDCNNAALLAYIPSWLNGYPKPDGDFGYLSTTYKSGSGCKKCSIGFIQQNSFRLHKEPNWGTKKIFGLNWVFDEVFVKEEVYYDIFKPLGIESIPVVLHKNSVILSSVLQLNIPTTTNKIAVDTHLFEICSVCGCKKYNPRAKGLFPEFENFSETMPIFKSQEYFGSGGSASKKIFVTQELRQKMLKYKIKSSFMPTATKALLL